MFLHELAPGPSNHRKFAFRLQSSLLWTRFRRRRTVAHLSDLTTIFTTFLHEMASGPCNHRNFLCKIYTNFKTPLEIVFPGLFLNIILVTGQPGLVACTFLHMFIY